MRLPEGKGINHFRGPIAPRFHITILISRGLQRLSIFLKVSKRCSFKSKPPRPQSQGSYPLLRISFQTLPLWQGAEPRPPQCKHRTWATGPPGCVQRPRLDPGDGGFPATSPQHRSCRLCLSRALTLTPPSLPQLSLHPHYCCSLPVAPFPPWPLTVSLTTRPLFYYKNLIISLLCLKCGASHSN